MRTFRFVSILVAATILCTVAIPVWAQCTAPVVTQQPIDVKVNPGGSANLHVVASGTGPFAYQWLRQLFEASFIAIDGANSATFNTGVLTDTQAYKVQIVNECGIVESRLTTVTVTNECVPPSIVVQPADASINPGQTATLSVLANGGSLTYAWFEGAQDDTSKPVGTNSESFTTPVLNATTRYWVRISNSCGGVSSRTATVTVAAPCPAGRLCTLGGRFELTLAARDHRTGNTGTGVPLQQNDLFGFFSLPALTGDPNNPEVFVKMLDGRPVNGNFWVFYGGLTDLEYTLTVKDTIANTTKTYSKTGGTSNGGFDVGGGVTPETCQGEVDGLTDDFVAPGNCVANANNLCLNSGRFRIALVATDQRTGNSAVGITIPQTNLFGYFSLPGLTGNADNPEVFVKIVDGRAFNGFFWIFYSGLTDFEYALVVVDTTTGQVKVYQKAAGSACGFFDTNAF